MATLNAQIITLAGLNPSFAAAGAAGDDFVNSGREYLHVKNGSAAAVVVTIDSLVECNQGFTHIPEVSVPAAGERLIGPFPKARFNDSADKVVIAYSAHADVTVAVVRLP